MKLRFLFQIIVNRGENVVIDIRAKMPDRSAQQVQPVLQTRCPETAVSSIVQFLTASPIPDIDLIDIAHELERSVFSDVLMQRAAEFIRNIVFPVGECACSAEPVHDGTAGTVNASRYRCSVDGAVSLLKRSPRFQYNGLQIRSQDGKLIR